MDRKVNDSAIDITCRIDGSGSPGDRSKPISKKQGSNKTRLLATVLIQML